MGQSESKPNQQCLKVIDITNDNNKSLITCINGSDQCINSINKSTNTFVKFNNHFYFVDVNGSINHIPNNSCINNKNCRNTTSKFNNSCLSTFSFINYNDDENNDDENDDEENNDEENENENENFTNNYEHFRKRKSRKTRKNEKSKKSTKNKIDIQPTITPPIITSPTITPPTITPPIITPPTITPPTITPPTITPPTITPPTITPPAKSPPKMISKIASVPSISINTNTNESIKMPTKSTPKIISKISGPSNNINPNNTIITQKPVIEQSKTVPQPPLISTISKSMQNVNSQTLSENNKLIDMKKKACNSDFNKLRNKYFKSGTSTFYNDNNIIKTVNNTLCINDNKCKSTNDSFDPICLDIDKGRYIIGGEWTPGKK